MRTWAVAWVVACRHLGTKSAPLDVTRLLHVMHMSVAQAITAVGGFLSSLGTAATGVNSGTGTAPTTSEAGHSSGTAGANVSSTSPSNTGGSVGSINGFASPPGNQGVLQESVGGNGDLWDVGTGGATGGYPAARRGTGMNEGRPGVPRRGMREVQRRSLGRAPGMHATQAGAELWPSVPGMVAGGPTG